MVEAWSRSGVTRRSALKLGGVAAVGGFVPALVDTTARGDAVPTSARFDLAAPSYQLFRMKPLHESHHVMQSFAFDNVNRRLFVAQLQNGSSGDDLCISRLSFDGTLLGHMHLDGAGHGVSIGVEPVGSASYLWVECDSNSSGDTGRGTALARFKFVDGGTPSVQKFLTGSTAITCATDPVNRRLAVRRSEGGTMHYSIYDLADAAKGNFDNRLAHFAEPSTVDTGVTFQGYTLFGAYIYTMDGTVQPDASTINSHVTCIDVNTGDVVSWALTEAGRSLVYREPEGLAIYRTVAGETRLFLGFGSRTSKDSLNRYASLYYKNVLY